MAFPTTGELDSFNRANSASLGGNWTNDSIGAGSAGLAINSNLASNSLGGYGEMYWNVDAFTNVEAWCNVNTYADGSSWSGGLRMLMSPGSAAADGYGIQVNEAGRFKIIRIDNGDDSFELDDQGHTATDGEQIGFSLDTTTGILIAYADGIQVASALDSGYTGPFNISMWGYNGGGGAAIWTWDSFGGGEMEIFPPTATPVVPSYSRFPKHLLRRS